EEADGELRLTVEIEKQDARSLVLMTKHKIDGPTIEACQRGDSGAFLQIFEAYKDRVYSIALCLFHGTEATAKVIERDVFLKLLTTISQFRTDRNFRPGSTG